MKLTKRCKVLAAVFAVALVALVSDRLSFQPGPMQPDTAEASMMWEARGNPADSTTPAVGPATHWRNTLAERLAELAETEAFDGQAVPDAFSPPAGWIPQTPAQSPQSADRQAGVRTAYQLQAILVGADGNSAIINGKHLNAGEKLDDFTLTNIGKDSAVLVSGDMRVELKLVREELNASR